MGSAQQEAVKKLARQTYVTATYRWLIEVSFLFAAFTAFPEYKWPIGLGLLVFVGGVQAVVLTLDLMHRHNNTLADEAERKTRHAIVRAAELAAKGVSDIDQVEFWQEVDGRVRLERSAQEDASPTPVGFWKGLALASGAFVWQLSASVLGIAVVAGMTGG